MVRIAHISDSHLGSSLFQLTERREDARKCLKKAVEMAMRHSPDILVHTGDLYDSHFPSVEDQNFTTKLFKELSKKLPVVVLQGNHDMPFGYRYHSSPVRTLENAEFVISTGDKPTKVEKIECDGKEIELHLISWANHFVFTRFLDTTTPETDDAFFFAHDIPVRKENLPIHFQYYGFGHGHNFWLDEEYSIGRTGSTCIVDWRKEMGGNKRLIVVDADNENVEFTTEILNDTREFKFLTGLDISGMGPDEANVSIRNSLSTLSPKKEKPIVILQVNGMIDAETEDGIQRAELLKYGEKYLHPLFLHIEPNWVCLGPRKIDLSEPLNIQKSIEEYLEQTGTPDNESILSMLQEIVEG